MKKGSVEQVYILCMVYSHFRGHSSEDKPTRSIFRSEVQLLGNEGVPVRLWSGRRDTEKVSFVMAKRNAFDPKLGKVFGKDSQVVDEDKSVLDDVHDELHSEAVAVRNE